MIRGVLAVLAGVLLWGLLSTTLNAALTALSPDSFDEEGFTESAGLLLTYLIGSVPISIACGYVAAVIARARPMRVVAILAAIQLAIGVAVQASVWDRAPVWYHLPFLLMVVPAHLLGGRLRTERRAGETAVAS